MNKRKSTKTLALLMAMAVGMASPPTASAEHYGSGGLLGRGGNQDASGSTTLLNQGFGGAQGNVFNQGFGGTSGGLLNQDFGGTGGGLLNQGFGGNSGNVYNQGFGGTSGGLFNQGFGGNSGGFYNQNFGGTQGGITNQGFGEETPLGSGLFVLIAAGAGYASLKKRNKKQNKQN